MYDDERNEPGFDPGPNTSVCQSCNTSFDPEDSDAEEWTEFCSSVCEEEQNEEGQSFGPDYFDQPQFTGEPAFADPGGVSALRAASASNPRNLPCPNCGAANSLTPADHARGYQCDPCANQAELGGF